MYDFLRGEKKSLKSQWKLTRKYNQTYKNSLPKYREINLKAKITCFIFECTRMSAACSVNSDSL